MGQALAMFVLTYLAHAYAMAHLIDTHVLVYLANAAAFSGLMLAGLTSWGYLRYWWVLAKFAITVTQLYLGIFVLSPRLTAAAEHGTASPWLPVGTALMVAVPAADLALGALLLGFPSPFLQLLVAIGYPIRRRAKGHP
jgi:hypothetical protein